MTGGNIKEMAGEVARHEKLHPIDFGGHKRVMWTSNFLLQAYPSILAVLWKTESEAFALALLSQLIVLRKSSRVYKEVELWSSDESLIPVGKRQRQNARTMLDARL